MYETVKNNILKNFLIRNYLWSSIIRKEAMFDDMNNRFPFPFNYDYDNDVLMVNLGDNVNISFNFTWENSSYGQVMRYHLIKIN